MIVVSKKNLSFYLQTAQISICENSNFFWNYDKSFRSLESFIEIQ